jgi:LPS export ABC transporter protein LptC
MRFYYFLLIVAGIAIALTVGWFIDKRPSPVSENELQVPDNIDYYLEALTYRSYDSDGNLQYLLSSPRLEHFIREDRSVITHPDINYFETPAEWHIKAQQGSLQHADERLTLQNDVVVKRMNSQEPLTLYSNYMQLDPRNDLANFPQPIEVKSPGLHLQAQSAMLNMKSNQHQFHRVNAIYRREAPHVSG